MYPLHKQNRFRNDQIKPFWFLLLLGGLMTVITLTAGKSQQQAQTLYVPISANQGSYEGRHTAYTTGVQVMNLTNRPATIQLSAYNAEGAAVGASVYQVTDQMLTLYPLQAVATGFSGSLVLTSDQNSAAIVNLMSSDFSGGAAYGSRGQGATSVYLPLLFSSCSGDATWFSVQNTGTVEAPVQVVYSDGITATVTIKAGAAHTFYQWNEAHYCKVFAGTVTSTQPLVAAVVQEVGKIIFAYTGFTTNSNPKLLFPLVQSGGGAGYLTGIQIQNTGAEATEVIVSYMPSLTGTSCTETQTIPAGSSKTFALMAFHSNQSGTTTSCAPGARFVGSAQVTGNSTNQPLAGIANQLLPGKNGEAYAAFTPDEATAKVVMPLIMDRNGGFFTGFSVMNVGDTTTTVACTFINTSYTVTATLAPGQALADLQANKIAERYIGSGTCTGSGENAKLVAIVNELGAASDADQLLVYEGINQ